MHFPAMFDSRRLSPSFSFQAPSSHRPRSNSSPPTALGLRGDRCTGHPRCNQRPRAVRPSVAAKGPGRWACYSRSGTLRCKIRDEKISNSWCLEDWGTFRDSQLWFFKNIFWGILSQKSDHRSITNGKPTSLYRTGGNWNCASVVPTDAMVYPSQLNFWKLYIYIYNDKRKQSPTKSNERDSYLSNHLNSASLEFNSCGCSTNIPALKIKPGTKTHLLVPTCSMSNGSSQCYQPLWSIIQPLFNPNGKFIICRRFSLSALNFLRFSTFDRS